MMELQIKMSLAIDQLYLLHNKGKNYDYHSHSFITMTEASIADVTVGGLLLTVASALEALIDGKLVASSLVESSWMRSMRFSKVA